MTDLLACDCKYIDDCNKQLNGKETGDCKFYLCGHKWIVTYYYPIKNGRKRLLEVKNVMGYWHDIFHAMYYIQDDHIVAPVRVEVKYKGKRVSDKYAEIIYDERLKDVKMVINGKRMTYHELMTIETL